MNTKVIRLTPLDCAKYKQSEMYRSMWELFNRPQRWVETPIVMSQERLDEYLALARGEISMAETLREGP